MSARLSNSFILLLSILLIASFYIPWLSFFALVPIFFYLEKGKFYLPTISMFFPFLVFIYSGIYKSTHVYYGLPIILSVLLVILLSAYHLFYLILAIFLFKKSKLGLWVFPIFFVGMEFLKDKLFYGMPLGNLNILVYNLPFFIKDATILGGLFIDFKILLVNLAIYYTIKKETIKALGVAIPVLLALFLSYPKPIQSFKTSIAVIQANIPQEDKWKVTMLDKNFKRYLNMSNGLKADVVIWPESAYPYIFLPQASHRIKSFIEKNSFALVFGALTKNFEDYYNSVVFINKQKLNIYNKRKLVPFAEFIPFAKLLGLEEYNFTPGRRGVIFKQNKLAIAPLICYEENFENLSRQYKNNGANMIVVLTNDAWFDKTPTFFLFPRSDVYRAVENHIWVVRAANTGLSFIVNPFGKIVKELKPDTKATLKAKLNLTVYIKTFYDRYGWLFGYIMLFVSILLLFYKTGKNRIK